MQFEDGVDERGAVAHRGDDIVARLDQQELQAFPQQQGVVRDHEPHGTAASITVGPPTGEATFSTPSTARTRSARPTRP